MAPPGTLALAAVPFLGQKRQITVISGYATTLRIDDATYREAKAEAARCGVTLTKFLEEALRQKIASSRGDPMQHPGLRAEIEDRNRQMEALLRRTAHFRVGTHPTREEVNAR